MSKNLTQNDFRRLLMTPARNRPTTPSRSKADAEASRRRLQREQAKLMNRQAQEEKDKAAPKKEKKEKKAPKWKGASGELYRDRAAERRLGMDDDFAATEDIAAKQRDLETKQNRERTIEESKFLGGDIEHTHLVKGLDYALLRKTRASKADEDVEKEMENTLQSTESAPRTAGTVITPKIMSEKGTRVLAFLNRQKEPTNHTVESFLPGRSGLTFQTDEDATFEVTHLRRSKAACAAYGKIMPATIPFKAIFAISKAMSYIKPASHKLYKKLKKQHRAELKQQEAEAEALKLEEEKNKINDDIFADVGDYSVDKPLKDIPVPKSQKAKYFDDHEVEYERATAPVLPKRFKMSVDQHQTLLEPDMEAEADEDSLKRQPQLEDVEDDKGMAFTGFNSKSLVSSRDFMDFDDLDDDEMGGDDDHLPVWKETEQTRKEQEAEVRKAEARAKHEFEMLNNYLEEKGKDRYDIEAEPVAAMPKAVEVDEASKTPAPAPKRHRRI
eukprot:TRINITY_DN8531_c0_g1_i1.p1 TRINITY_DN8531_c0_g1~~TRINITY_DN8531_c0_g1_i1.p1  ORF type:complete len:499 (-),score=158.08 TRINITY_DN8531_c0_g1_i1:17-1513(-)